MAYSNSSPNLTQFSKDSLNWGKITKDSEQWECLDKNFNEKKSSGAISLNGTPTELIKPAICDAFRPPNSQRVIRRKLISKDAENVDPRIIVTNLKRKTYQCPQQNKQPQELLNYVECKTIPADNSYQTLIFNAEETARQNVDRAPDVNLLTKYMEVAKICGAYTYQKLINFKNNQHYILKTQRINAFSLKIQLRLKFAKLVFFFYFLHYKQNLNFTYFNAFILFGFTSLSIACNYFSLTCIKETDVSYSNEEIIRKINTSSSFFLVKKYILAQNMFLNSLMPMYFLRIFWSNFNMGSLLQRYTAYSAFLALIVVNILVSLDELVLDVVPIFFEIIDSEKEIIKKNSQYNGNIITESINKVN